MKKYDLALSLSALGTMLSPLEYINTRSGSKRELPEEMALSLNALDRMLPFPYRRSNFKSECGKSKNDEIVTVLRD